MPGKGRVLLHRYQALMNTLIAPGRVRHSPCCGAWGERLALARRFSRMTVRDIDTRTTCLQSFSKELIMDTTALPQEAPETGLGLHPVLSMSRHVDELPSYVVPDTGLEMGASLGNSSCWVTTKGTGDVESVFS